MVVEPWPHHPEVKGSSPVTAAGIGREKIGQKSGLSFQNTPQAFFRTSAASRTFVAPVLDAFRLLVAFYSGKRCWIG